MEPLKPPPVQLHLVDDLQCDFAPQRLLDCFVDDPHSAAAQLGDDPEITELRRHRSGRRQLGGCDRSSSEALDHCHRRQ